MSVDPEEHIGVTRILVADDEPEIRYTVTVNLEAEGWLVEQAASGREAIERCRREAFDILVLDYMMPEMNGLTVARQLLAEGIHVPTILFTAYLVAELKTTCDLLGLLAVDKINFAELVLCCRRLEEKRLRQDAPPELTITLRS